MGSQRSRRQNQPVFILIGDGFDELEVVFFLHKFRQAGICIKSVSLFKKLVFSRQGVGIKADFTLADNPIGPAENCILILPTGGLNGDALRRDARVRRLLHGFKQQPGRVVLTDSDSELAHDVEQLLRPQATVHERRGEPLDRFVDQLAQQMVYV
jgi:putative intracellular protease/amidase